MLTMAIATIAFKKALNILNFQFAALDNILYS